MTALIRLRDPAATRKEDGGGVHPCGKRTVGAPVRQICCAERADCTHMPETEDHDAGTDERQAAMFEARLAEQDKAHPGYREVWEGFQRCVLRHGGRRVVPPFKPDPLIGLLTVEARVIDGASVEVSNGDPSDCHRNAVGLWRTGECDAIGTGYALSTDGLWRQHSWGVREGEPVETTVRRLKYFGIVMSDEKARWFADWIDPPH